MKHFMVELGFVTGFIFLLGVASCGPHQSAALIPVILEEAANPWTPKEYCELLVETSRVTGIDDMETRRHQLDKARQGMPWRRIRTVHLIRKIWFA